MHIPSKDRIIVALDVDSEQEAVRLAGELKDHVGFFKVGLELIYAAGLGVVRTITEVGGRVFLDTKLMDIPNTVAGASRAVVRLGVRAFNVHILGGTEMLKASVKAASAQAGALGVQRPLVFGVTILTSIDEAAMNEQLGIPGSAEAQVVRLANAGIDAGLDGVIASPLEVKAIRRAISQDTLIVTPGVRPAWASMDDQKRVMHPGEAVKAGASYVVVGRPITRPPSGIGSPVDAAKRIAEEIEAEITG